MMCKRVYVTSMTIHTYMLYKSVEHFGEGWWGALDGPAYASTTNTWAAVRCTTQSCTSIELYTKHERLISTCALYIFIHIHTRLCWIERRRRYKITYMYASICGESSYATERAHHIMSLCELRLECALQWMVAWMGVGLPRVFVALCIF